MITPQSLKKYYYIYCSFEDWPGGRSYIGRRGCDCLPEEDVNYFGSFTDKTFKPNKKIILLVIFTEQEACHHERFFQEFFEVVPNPHYVNRSIQTSTGFYYSHSPEDARKYGKIAKEQKLGIYGLSKEERIQIAKKGGNITKEQKLGIHGLSKEEIIQNAKKGGKIGGAITAELMAKEFEIMAPNGEIIRVKNIRQFCRNNNLDSANLRKVINGERSHHKGYILPNRQNLILIGE